jgi:hypothetical protein
MTKQLIECLTAKKASLAIHIDDLEYNASCDRIERIEEGGDDELLEPLCLTILRDELRKINDLLSFYESNKEEYGYLWDL